MEYTDLPLSVRIDRATEFAIILSNEPNKTPELVIAELAQTFSLSNEEARQAYIASKTKFADEYSAAQKNKLYFYISAFIAGIAGTVLYFFFSKEAGGFFMIFSMFFLFTSIGIVIQLIKSKSEDFFIKRESLRTLSKKLKKNFLVQIFPVLFIFFVITFWQNFLTHIYTEKDVEFRPFVLKDEIHLKSTGGKSPQNYFEFKFEDYNPEFNFYHDEYRFANSILGFYNLKKGDTVIVGILKEDMSNLYQGPMFSSNNTIMDIQVKGKGIIDYAYRYKKLKSEHSRWFNIVSLLFVLDIISIYFLARYHLKQRTT
ncbi:hypothetical protein [Ferruginibacter albus]|uniref:hypothetical protein n=1 Tax=Ferruginibacter albus TaxID=2875540 RepID=UPI001CC6194D|nr:hypothetical protein [Ferruginibacter albus]UAY51783.1 hypothetical protein K9M53_14455 [Ferruginibacter albus]